MANPSSTSGFVARLHGSISRWLVLCGILSLVLALDLAALPSAVSAEGIVASSSFRTGTALSVAHPLGTFVVRSSDLITRFLYFPFIFDSSTVVCRPVGETYGTTAISGSPTLIPADSHPDLNLSIRGYASVSATLSLVYYGGSSDSDAPQLPGLFTDNRTGRFTSAYQVYDWNWQSNSRGPLLNDWPVTMAGLATTPGEVLQVPGSGYSIGSEPLGYEALVLYASTTRLTITFTRNDSVAQGYSLHYENICVDPNLLRLYQEMNAAGRWRLPALVAGQGVGRATSNEMRIAVRDWGTFMDPRSEKDWWQGRQ